MNRGFHLISRDKNFSNQFSVHVSIHNINNMAAIPAAIAVLRNNRGVWRQTINREACVIFFYGGKVYSDDIYT